MNRLQASGRTRDLPRSLTIACALVALLAISGCAPRSAEPSAELSQASPSTGNSPSPTLPASPATIELTVTSEDFEDFGPIPAAHASCGDGNNNLNPALMWEGAPHETKSYVIAVVDPDAGGYVHWLHVNVPAEVTYVATGASTELAGDAGLNNTFSSGYRGPCPPTPGHRYEFWVWALDTVIEFETSPSLRVVNELVEGHVIARGVTTGIY